MSHIYRRNGKIGTPLSDERLAEMAYLLWLRDSLGIVPAEPDGAIRVTFDSAASKGAFLARLRDLGAKVPGGWTVDVEGEASS